MVVLDTHIWLWWLSSPLLLSAKGKEALKQAAAREEVYISSISAWEVAVLVKRGRLELSMGARDWIAQSEALPFIKFVPVNNHIALKSTELSAEFPDNPADRIIAATALFLGAPLITKDKRIIDSRLVKTVW